MAGIYFHIPFCKRLCGYCDFFKSARLDRLDAFVERALTEIGERCDYLPTKRIETIYFGGGTPSLLSVEQVQELLQRCAEVFDVSAVEEVTMEVNPDDLSREYLEGLYAAGVNRLSIGIQSFDDGLLHFMNRRHDAQQAQEAVRLAREVGFENITIDIIFGVDGFAEEVLERTLEQALALDVEHISAYHLSVEQGTEFARRVSRKEMREVSEEQSEREFAIVHERLTAAGYEHYEVSNYARKGYISKHNSSYWRGVPYLGIGAGAHSFDGESRQVNLPMLKQYLEGDPTVVERETLTLSQRYNEYVMTSLRWCGGVEVEFMRAQFGEVYVALFDEAVERWIKSGEIVAVGGRVFLLAEHYLLSDMIIESLFCYDGEV